ncbi:MAG TPA: hypothetical protein VFW11_15990 [Cyclobacteriaceae bacterium]|nr:hypothetical protein [Cyclobacteriaceae bacterium]
MMLISVDSIQFKNLVAGDPLLLRATISREKTDSIKKGDIIAVVCDKSKAKAKIISDPITIIDRLEEGEKEISLEVIQES